jgi:hypothetical protein
MTRISQLATASALSFGLLLVAATTASAQIACPQGNDPSRPAVSSQNIFCGEIDEVGSAFGFHSRPGGHNPDSVNSTGAPITAGMPAGIYRLEHFNIVQRGTTRVKEVSTMFPDACDQAAVLAAIRNAAGGAQPGQKFNGVSGPTCQAGNPAASFNITGFMNMMGEITVAYPNY